MSMYHRLHVPRSSAACNPGFDTTQGLLAETVIAYRTYTACVLGAYLDVMVSSLVPRSSLILDELDNVRVHVVAGCQADS